MTSQSIMLLIAFLAVWLFWKPQAAAPAPNAHQNAHSER